MLSIPKSPRKPQLNSMKRILLSFALAAFCAANLSAEVPQAPRTKRSAGQSTASIDPARKLKNPPVLSAGSGKELADFKSGTYTMTSAGLERKYTIDIPADYDKSKPYRLIFAMHMMGGHMNTMVGNKFYGLKTFAERDHIPVIFVAPEGYTDQSPWRGRDDKDHVFFADMLAHFKEELSIDTSRVFCAGFSFGAMVTYSL